MHIRVAEDFSSSIQNEIGMPQGLRRKINDEFNKISTHDTMTYYEAIPLDKVSNILKENNIVMQNEDDTPLKFVMLTGADGRASFNLKLDGQKVSNAMVIITWHKMPSKKYEFLVYLS